MADLSEVTKLIIEKARDGGFAIYAEDDDEEIGFLLKTADTAEAVAVWLADTLRKWEETKN
jgi:hypothetical protein